MKWLKSRIKNWLSDKHEAVNYPTPYGAEKIATQTATEFVSEATMQFIVYSAIGGKIIEFRQYGHDRKTSQLDSRPNTTLYIIGKNEDFGARIAKIAMLESMKE